MDNFMSLKIKMIFKPKLKDMSINELFLKNIKIFLKKIQDLSSRIKRKLPNIFVKGSKKSPTCVFYNYYCHISYISLDCKLRKKNNIINII
jgi:hypothetical protein